MKRSNLFRVIVATAFFVLPVSVLPKGEDAGLSVRSRTAQTAKARRYIKGSSVLARQGTKMDPGAKTVTIEGAVRDLACPIQNPAASATSFSLQCNLDCVKHGSPIIILTKEGLIYFPISKDMPDSDQREKMMPFVGKFVQASGPAFTRNGTHAIAITEIKELKNIHIEDAGE